MHNKHPSFKVDLGDLVPLEVVRLAAALEREDAAVVDAQVQLVASVVLRGSGIWIKICDEVTK